MKITGLRVLIFERRPDPHNETPEYIVHPTRQNGLAIIDTDTGIQGMVSAEGTFLRQLARGWAGAREQIEGQDPFDRERIADLLRRRFKWTQITLGLLDLGLWDIAGKALGQPVYKLLGAARDQILAYASTVHHGTDERFLESVLRAKDKGYKAIKLHPYCNCDDDLRLVYKVRRAVGDEMVLMIDTIAYPGPYNRADAFRMGRALDELNYLWFEDPLVKEDLEGLAALARECKVVQVRAADNAQNLRECANLITRGEVDIIAAPGMWGISESMKVAALAQAHNIKMEPHDFYFYGGAASLHVALAATNADYYELAVPEGCFDTSIYPGVYLTAPSIDKEGYIHGTTTPGLGFDVDLKEAEKVTVERL
ncbi:MAG: mandelate racemase/muconate lactonizing enzyme family protein [Chloroflexota bacterium]